MKLFILLLASAITITGCATSGTIEEDIPMVDPISGKLLETCSTDPAGIVETCKPVLGKFTLDAKPDVMKAHMSLQSNDKNALVYKDIELAKQQRFACGTVNPTLVVSMSASGQAEYWKSVGECHKNGPMWAMASMADEGFAEVRAASGQGSDMTRVAESWANADGVAAQANASKHSTWGKIVGLGLTGFFLADAAKGIAAGAAAGAGTRIVNANGSRLTYVDTGGESYADGVNANVFSDGGTLEATGTPQTGQSTPVSSSGDHTGDINVDNSPIFMDAKNFEFTNLGPQSIQVQGGGTLSIPNNSNDNNAFGAPQTGDSSPNNTATPTVVQPLPVVVQPVVIQPVAP